MPIRYRDGRLCNADSRSHIPQRRLKTFFGSLYQSLAKGARCLFARNICPCSTKAFENVYALAQSLAQLTLSHPVYRAIFQFYPETPQQMELITSAAMRCGFSGVRSFSFAISDYFLS